MSVKATGVQIVLSQHCNGYQKPRLFGGQLMAWIDVVGAVAAQRHTKSAVTTICVDNLTFLKPAFLGDTIFQEATVTWTGRTSIEVKVDSYIERLDGEKILTNRAYVVYVAIDEEGNSKQIPAFIPETEEEREEYEAAFKRREIRLQRQQAQSQGEVQR